MIKGSYGLIKHRAKLHNLFEKAIGCLMPFEAVARLNFNFLGQFGHAKCAQLDGFGFEQISRTDHRNGIIRAHRIFDRCHGLATIITKIAKHTKKVGAKRSSGLLEPVPIHCDVI